MPKKNDSFYESLRTVDGIKLKRKKRKPATKPLFHIFAVFLFLLFSTVSIFYADSFAENSGKFRIRAERAVVEFEGIKGKPEKPAISVLDKSISDQAGEKQNKFYSSITTPIIFVNDSDL